MAEIAIGIETEGDNHWSYDVVVTTAQGVRHEFVVRLSWQDYDLWSHGRVAPSRVVEAAFEFLLSREPAAEILPKFDCAVIRRYFPDVDKQLPTLF